MIYSLVNFGYEISHVLHYVDHCWFAGEALTLRANIIFQNREDTFQNYRKNLRYNVF